GNLAYRLNLAYEEGGNFQDFAESEFLFIAPAFQLINTEDTELILDFEHSRTRSRGAGPGLPAIPAIGIENNTLPALEAALSGGASQFTLDSLESAGELDLRTNVGEPDLSESETIINRVGYQYSHRFSDDWRFESQFLASFQESTPDNVFAGTGYEQVAGQTDFESAVRLFLENPSRREGYTVNANVVGDFDILGLEQTLLFGAEWSYEVERDKITQTLQQNSTLVQDPQTGAISFEDYGRFNVFDPNYESRRFVNPDSLINLGGLALDSLTITETVGIYGQTQIDLVDGLSIVLGGRFDMADQFFADAVNTANPEINAYDTAFSPRLGLVFSPVDSLSVYATYAESFQPTIGRGVDGDVFIPERGKQFEAGIKASLLDDRLLATFAYYDLSRINVLTQDPDNPGFQVQVGEQSSEGFEFDLVGEILPGWNIIASYAYTDAKVTEDEVFEVGTRLVNAPDHAASLWTSYQVQAGALEGLGLGVGVYFVGDRNGDIRVPFEIPSYTRTDASIFYQGEGVRAQINFQNLFDVRYFEGARDQNRVIPGQPFTITGSLSWTF
ncbi:MAG: TonB-dependent siderophore receptor, partial [Cyanobacteria bacterium P01_H01_bin.58]